MPHCNFGYPAAFGGWLFGHGPLHLLLILVLAAILVYILYRGSRALIGKSDKERDADDSMEILRARFARGDISAEEYQRMREILGR